MTVPKSISFGLVLLVTLAFCGGTTWSQEDNSPAGNASTDDFEVLPRGPVHEAFAEPVVFNPQPNEVIAKRPPEAIEELPSDEKPEGENVAWLPGYWSWDDDRNDFIWVSGFWRAIPPGQQWVPGYWTEAEGGWLWVSGYWAKAESDEVEYLPPPPDSLEVGPSTERPADDYVWIPGAWQWYESRYAWKPGYWYAAQPNWVWMPSRYSWTPRGCVYVPGYWDYPLETRGILFAPVYYANPIYTRPAYAYRPSFVVNFTVVTNHFFVRPNRCHYYFGNYYAPGYVNQGFVPWFAYHQRRGCYDANFAYYRHQHYHDQWERNLHQQYNHLRDHADDRPPVSFSDIVGSGPGVSSNKHAIVVPMQNFARDKALPFPIQQISHDRQIQFQQVAAQTRDLGRQRIEIERGAAKVDVKNPFPRHPALDKNGPDINGPGKVAQPTDPAAPRFQLPNEKSNAKLPDAQHAADKVKRPRSPVAFPVVSRPPGNDTNPRDNNPEGKLPGDRAKPGQVGDNDAPSRPKIGDRENHPPGAKLPNGSGKEPEMKLPPRNPGNQNPGNQNPGNQNPGNQNPGPKNPGERDHGDKPVLKLPMNPNHKDEPKSHPKIDLPGRDRPRDIQPVNPRQPNTPQPKVETPRPKVETPMPKPKAEPRIELPKRDTPNSQPKPVQRPEPRVEPKPQPRVEPRAQPQPRMEPKPQPRIEPRPQPKSAPTPQPRVAPQPQPKVQPRIAPQIREQRPTIVPQQPAQHHPPGAMHKGKTGK